MTDRDRNRGATPEHSGADARQGEIILRTRWRRFVFIGGLVGLAVLALLFGFLGAR